MNPSPSERVAILGSDVPVSHGAFADEYRALTESAALLSMPWEANLRVVGKDAGRFLQNLLTQDVLSLAPGDSAPAALASRKGHLEADLQIVRETEGFRLRLQRRLLESFTQTLDRYRIVEDVQWKLDPEPQASFLLAGPAAEEIWARLDAPEGGEAMVVHEITPTDVFITLAQDGVEKFRETLRELRSPRVPTIGWRAFNVARIEVGRAWFGIDADEERLVPEPGFGDRIDYEKGCYLGQETIARLFYRGKLNWKLERLRFEPSAPGADRAQPGADIFCEGARVGWLTSTGVKPDGTGVALGYLHRKVRESPGPLSLTSDCYLTVLP